MKNKINVHSTNVLIINVYENVYFIILICNKWIYKIITYFMTKKKKKQFGVESSDFILQNYTLVIHT